MKIEFLISILLLMALFQGGSEARRCLGSGSRCGLDWQCCSRECYRRVCQPGNGCVNGGGKCSTYGACCSNTCIRNTCSPQGSGRCTALGGACKLARSCCSNWCSRSRCTNRPG